MNSFDSVLLCTHVMTSPVVMVQSKIELGNSSTADICFDPNKRKEAAAWQISFGTNTMELHSLYAQENESKKMEIPRRKDATESYVYRQQINISQFEIRSVTQLLAFQCTSVSKQHGQGVVSGLSLPLFKNEARKK